MSLFLVVNASLLKLGSKSVSVLQLGFFKRDRPPTDSDDDDENTHELKEEQPEYADVSLKDES